MRRSPVLAAALVLATAAASSAFEFRLASLMPESGPSPLANYMQRRSVATLELAIADINADADLLGGHTLVLDQYDSGLSAATSYPSARSIVFPTADGCGVNETTNYHGIIGGVSSGAMQPVIFMARAQSMPVVSAYSQSPSFSDKSTYPNMLRTTPPVVEQNGVFVDLMRRYGWERAAVLTTDDAYGRELLDPLLDLPQAADLELRAFKFNFKNATNVLEVVESLAATNYQVVYLHAPPLIGYLILGALESSGLLLSDRVFVATDTLITTFVERFADAELKAKMRGWLHTSVEEPGTAAYGTLGARLHALNSTVWPDETTADLDDAQAYDIALAYAHGLAAAVAATAPDKPTAADVLEAMSDAGFTFGGGMSLDPFVFDANLDRTSGLVVTNRDASGALVRVEFASETDRPASVVWPNGARGADVPPDTPPNELRERSEATEAAVMGFASLGLVLTVAIQAAVHKFRDSPVIRAASVPFCHMILAACSLAQLAVIVNAALPPSPGSDAACAAFPAMLSVAYAGIFGALVSKTQRLNAIFNSRKVRVQRYSAAHVARPVVALVAYNLVVCAVWFAVDMPGAERVEDPVHENSDVHVCRSENDTVWFALLVGPAAAVALVACYLAYRVRNLAGQFNEAKQILVSVYNLTLLGSLTLGLVSTVGDQINVSLALQSFSISFIAASTAVALFASKFWMVYTGEDQNGSGTGAATVIKHTPAGSRIHTKPQSGSISSGRTASASNEKSHARPSASAQATAMEMPRLGGSAAPSSQPASPSLGPERAPAASDLEV